MQAHSYVSSGLIFRFLLSGLLLTGTFFFSPYIIIAIIMLMNCYCAYALRRNNIAFFAMAFILFSNYSIFAYYWFDLFGSPITNRYINWLEYPEVIQIGLMVLFVFSATLYCVLPSFADNEIHIYLVGEDKGKNPFMGLLFLIGIILIICVSIFLTYRSGVYTERTIYEYTTVLYILALYHIGHKKPLTYLLFGVMAVDILFILINGDRGHALQLMLMVYCVFLHDKLPKWTLVLPLIIGIIGMNAVGIWRGRGTFSVEVLADSLTKLRERKFVLDTAYAAEGSGLGMVYLTNVYGFGERLRLFAVYILSIFVGTSALSPDANLAAIVINEGLYASGGGVLPNYGYFYLGYFGVIALGLLVCFYISLMAKCTEKTSGLKQCISVYLFSTITSWYLYSPAPLIRGVLLLSILYLFSTKIRINLR